MPKLDWNKDNCPNKANHTPCPDGYIQWHAWAQKMGRTHRATKCPTCDLYTIWMPKKRRLSALAKS